jgi:hypothetical protein
MGCKRSRVQFPAPRHERLHFDGVFYFPCLGFPLGGTSQSPGAPTRRLQEIGVFWLIRPVFPRGGDATIPGAPTRETPFRWSLLFYWPGFPPRGDFAITRRPDTKYSKAFALGYFYPPDCPLGASSSLFGVIASRALRGDAIPSQPSHHFECSDCPSGPQVRIGRTRDSCPWCYMP